jgi:hypothetical protein
MVCCENKKKHRRDRRIKEKVLYFKTTKNEFVCKLVNKKKKNLVKTYQKKRFI